MIKTHTVPILSISHLAIMTQHYLDATAGDREDPLQSAQCSGGYFVYLGYNLAECGFPEFKVIRLWLETQGYQVGWVHFAEDGQVVDALRTFAPYSEEQAEQDMKLSPRELANKYVGSEFGHPCISVSQWQAWVNDGCTIEGYWEWVSTMLRESEYYELIGNQTE